jgi:hypothetical protein
MRRALVLMPMLLKMLMKNDFLVKVTNHTITQPAVNEIINVSK